MAVALYVVMLISVGADGGPDGWGQKVTIHNPSVNILYEYIPYNGRLTLYAQIC